MDGAPDRAGIARQIVDANRYMILATADGDGRPWATPVWFAHSDYREFIWMSRPDSRHSRNVAVREEVGIVIFDSTIPPARRQAVYVEAVARELSGGEREAAVEVFSRRSVGMGLDPLDSAEVSAPAEFRLYCAATSDCFVLDEAVDRRIAVSLT